jgi:ATP-dependent DNA ligase
MALDQFRNPPPGAQVPCHPWTEAARTRFMTDSEAVVSGGDGVADFENIHSQANDASVFVYAFDLLSINGVTFAREKFLC